MKEIEPSYLRYIYDGLIKGSIHPENAAELSEGLIGLYEEAFDEKQPVHLRQQLLEHFAIWALLKKEVSVAFVANVLGQTEEGIQEFISTYSAWFNSPESGKYQLYHERLKVYLLQKLSEGKIHELHEKLILRLEHAIETQKADEFDWYGLEFLVQHYFVNAMLNGDGSKLLVLAYNQNHWQRQLKISKGYTWTRNGLTSVMLWASKYNDEEVIVCGLQMVDLHHQEQNAAPQIVALVAEGDFDSALNRIEQFGGNDKEGLERKFILYIICLMNLTLFDSKEKLFQRKGIEMLLKHFDEQMPVDHSILNWNDFFSSELIFNLSTIWAKLGIDYLIVYKRTNEWDYNWIGKERKKYSQIEFKILNKTALLIKNKDKRFEVLSVIAFTKGKIDSALKYARRINNSCGDMTRNISKLATKILFEKRKNKVDNLIEESILSARNISSEWYKSYAISLVGIEILKQGEMELFDSIIQELFIIKKDLDNYSDKFKFLKISDKLAKEGDLNGALELEMNIWLSEKLNEALSIISLELIRKGEIVKSLEYARNIKSDFFKSNALLSISTELMKLGHLNEVELIQKEVKIIYNRSKNEITKCRILSFMTIELLKQGKQKQASKFIKKIQVSASKINEVEDRESILTDLLLKLVNHHYINLALQCVNFILDNSSKRKVFSLISNNFLNQKNNKEATKIFFESITPVKNINAIQHQDSNLSSISIEFAQQGKFDEAMKITNHIRSEFTKIVTQIKISNKELDFELIKKTHFEVNQGFQFLLKNELNLKESQMEDFKLIFSRNLAKQGKIQDAIKCCESINSIWWRSLAIRDIGKELYDKSKYDEASLIFKKSLECAREIENDFGDKSDALNSICKVIIDQGNLEFATLILDEAVSSVDDIIFEIDKSRILVSLTLSLYKIGDLDGSNRILQEAIFYARGIEEPLDKLKALSNIIETLSKLERKEEAILIRDEQFLLVNDIDFFEDKCEALVILVIQSAEFGDFKLAEEICEVIPLNSKRIEGWQELIKIKLKLINVENDSNLTNIFEINKGTTHLLKEWIKSISFLKCTKDFVVANIIYFISDLNNLELFLYKFSLRNIYFEQPSNKYIDHYNHTLDLHWAIDVKKQISKIV